VERLRQSLDLIRAQLGALSATHRLLVAAAVIVLIMSLLLVGAYSSRSDMARLSIDASRKAESLAMLTSNGLDVIDKNGSLFVPVDQQTAALAVLSENGAASGADAIDMMELMKSQQWWQNRSQNQQLVNAATAKYLGSVINHWSYVSSANVIINTPLEQPALGKSSLKPTASIAIQTRSGELTSEQVRALADFISGAVSGLTPENVKVIDARSGRSLRVADPGRFTTGTYAELRSKVENDYEQKIAQTLRFIPAVIVAVNAQLDIAEEVVSDLTFKDDGKGTIQAPKSTRTNSTENGSKTDGGVAGVAPNTGTSLDTGSSSGTTSTSSESENTFETHAGKREVNRSDPKGYAKKVNATINIPRSYFTRIWKQQNASSTTEPTDADLDPLVKRHVADVENMVKPLIDTTAHRDPQDSAAAAVVGSVVVSMYYDFDGAGALSLGGATSQASFGGGMVGSVLGSLAPDLGRLVRDVGLGVIALVALIMMFRLVRAASQKRPLPSAEEIVGIPPVLQGDSDLIGEADAAEPAMEAVELHEGDLRIQGLIEQVDEMVTASPNDTARLVTRWLNNAA